MSKQPRPDFKIKLGNDPILEVEPIEIIHTDITYGVQIPNCVPFYEVDIARIEAGYNMHEWDKLEYFMKVKEVAIFRMRKLIGLHEGDAQILHTRLSAKRGL